METKYRRAVWIYLCTTGFPAGTIAVDGTPHPDQARQAMVKAVTYFRDQVATEGGYLWWYSPDLKERWGEGKASRTQVWVQPPGTPSVGLAMLQAWERTGEDVCLAGARDAAHALVRGQLNSGGWGYSIEFDPDKREGRCYRADGHGLDDASCHERGHLTTYDDDTTQSAIRFLARYDWVTDFQDRQVHDCVTFALETVLRTQYPNGGWPQRTWGEAEPSMYPPRRAQYPKSWAREWPHEDYISYCTINDRVIPDLIDTLIVAHEIYRDERYLQAALRGGEFLIRAQMPDPQPAWAQQYDHDMCPAWARKFEPPAVVTSESCSALRALMQLYVVTGQDRFRAPIPRAIAWMKKVQLPDGRIPRFLELGTDRPLYFTRDYKLVYTSDDLPTHYGFITRVPLDDLQKRLEGLDEEREAYVKLAGKRRDGKTVDDAMVGTTSGSGGRRIRPAEVQAVINALDDQGRWVEEGRIESETFIRNLGVLSAYVAQTDMTQAEKAVAMDHLTRKVSDVRVMTFNIRYGTASDGPNHWDKRKDLVVDVLQSHAPEVVGMQEALRFQTDYIREKLPHYREVGVGREDGMEKGEYVPILYDGRRFYAGASGTFWLSKTPDIPGSSHWGNDIPRICTWARLIDRESGTAFYLYNVHLDHVAQESREKGVHLIARRIARRAHPDPVVLTGDMNATEDNPAMRFLLGQGERPTSNGRTDLDGPVFADAHRMIHAESDNEATFNAWTGKQEGDKIDYIFVMKSDPPIEVGDAEIVRDHRNDRYPSDHYPVQAVLCMPECED